MSLRAEALCFSYGAHAVLQDVCVDARPGELLVILGPNGAGKSTLLRLLAGLLQPASGQVLLGEAPLGTLTRSEIAQRIALVPQELPPEAGFSVLELVLMGRAPRLGAWGIESATDRARAWQALAELEIESLAKKMLCELSGGEKRRVLLARARCQDGAVVLLDEPTAHLDLGHQAQALSLAARWAHEGATVLAVLHDPNLARTHADRVVLVHADGRAEPGGISLLKTDTLSKLYGCAIEEVALFRAARR